MRMPSTVTVRSFPDCRRRYNEVVCDRAVLLSFFETAACSCSAAAPAPPARSGGKRRKPCELERHDDESELWQLRLGLAERAGLLSAQSIATAQLLPPRLGALFALMQADRAALHRWAEALSPGSADSTEPAGPKASSARTGDHNAPALLSLLAAVHDDCDGWAERTYALLIRFLMQVIERYVTPWVGPSDATAHTAEAESRLRLAREVHNAELSLLHSLLEQVCVGQCVCPLVAIGVALCSRDGASARRSTSHWKGGGGSGARRS